MITAKIMLIEDNEADILLTRKALEKSKLLVDLTEFKDGESALNHLMESEKEDYPDLILLDLNLPRLHGLELLKEIKNHPELRVVPVIVLTSSNAEEDIVASYQNYANSYIRKPLNMDSFQKIAMNLKEFWFTLVKLPKK